MNNSAVESLLKIVSLRPAEVLRGRGANATWQSMRYKYSSEFRIKTGRTMLRIERISGSQLFNDSLYLLLAALPPAVTAAAAQLSIYLFHCRAAVSYSFHDGALFYAFAEAYHFKAFNQSLFWFMKGDFSSRLCKSPN